MVDHYAQRSGEARSQKLTAFDVREIRRRRAKHTGKRLTPWHRDSVSSLAEEFGISTTHVSMIVHGRKWRRV